jgi:hypothetical protein
MRKVTCRCENQFDADLPDTIDLDAEPCRRDSVIAEILGGIFFQVVCPSCGAVLKPELRVRIVSKSNGIDLTILPELERLSFYRGAVDLPRGSQALVGYAELIERARIMADGFDPVAIEILKYWLLAKAEESAPDAEIAVRYAGIEGGKLSFHLSGLKEGEIAVLPIGRELYERTLADRARSLRTPPFDKLFSGAYRSIRMLELSEE